MSMTQDTIEAITADVLPDAAREIVSAWLRATISAPIALMRLVIVFGEAQPVVAFVSSIIEQILATFLPASDLHQRAAAMQALLKQHRSGLEYVSDLLRTERQQQLSPLNDPLAHWAAMFDAWVKRSEEASVALYSFGDAALLEVATAEVVELLDAWKLLGPDRVILQIGCGIGRFEAALSGRVQAAYGIDISAEMVAVAQRRCAALKNVHLMTCSGHDLMLFGSHLFDLVYAVDSFPYLHLSGSELVAKHFQDVHRVLRPGGSFVILNFSYRGSVENDRLEIEQLASQYRFEVLENGVNPFRVWDGLAWRLRRVS
jgi:SAM-dependent methyltransferase